MWMIRHAFAIAVLPGTVAILIPIWLCRRYGIGFHAPATVYDWVTIAFAAAIAHVGFILFVSTLFLFATEGRGTLGPWDPPEHLVVRGPYRYVRNPMISGVLLIVIAESVFLHSLVHASWAALFFVINAIYIPAIEEPQLRRRFGDAYLTYKQNVPRLLPRLRGWRQAE